MMILASLRANSGRTSGAPLLDLLLVTFSRDAEMVEVAWKTGVYCESRSNHAKWGSLAVHLFPPVRLCYRLPRVGPQTP